jgi:uncharacterized protein GlcG (DUF336 family)
MPIRRDGWVVAGLAASGAGIGPFVAYEGAVPEKLIADGRPANGEDLLVHYALGLPYEGQHGDDDARWVAAYGEFRADAGPGLGMADPPPAAAQHELGWALALADRAIEEARGRGLRIAVTIADTRGEAIQQDRMDGAVAASVAISETTAAAAATFGVPSERIGRSWPGLGLLASALPYRISDLPGAVPVSERDEIVGAIGIGGPHPHACEEIARAVAGA